MLSWTKNLFLLALLQLLKTQLSVAFRQDSIKDELNKYRRFESYVELRGGSFQIGIMDRNGINFENPQRSARTDPFRLD